MLKVSQAQHTANLAQGITSPFSDSQTNIRSWKKCAVINLVYGQMLRFEARILINVLNHTRLYTVIKLKKSKGTEIVSDALD